MLRCFWQACHPSRATPALQVCANVGASSCAVPRVGRCSTVTKTLSMRCIVAFEKPTSAAAMNCVRLPPQHTADQADGSAWQKVVWLHAVRQLRLQRLLDAVVRQRAEQTAAKGSGPSRSCSASNATVTSLVAARRL